MKIGILSPLSIRDFEGYVESEKDLPKGLECTVVTQLIEYYLQLGHEVVVATVTFGMKKPLVLKGNNLTIFVGNYRKYGKIRAVSLFSTEVNAMADFMKKEKCDIYHAHWEYEFALAALKADPDRTVVTLHDWPFAVYEQMHDYYRKKRLQMSLQVFDKCQYFTCVSDYIAKKFLGRYPYAKSIIVGNAIKNQDILKSVKARKNGNANIYTANNGFNELKNTKKTMEAFAIIKKAIPEAELHMYGLEHEKNGTAEKWAIENGLEYGIVFHGFCPHDVYIIELRDADLLIH